MNIVILDDYQDVVRKLSCASKLEAYPAKVYTNTIKGVGQLSVRLKDAEVLVLIRERTHLTRQLIEKLPKLKLISQTGKVGSHIDLTACTERGIAVAEGSGSPIAPAELTWALIMAAMRRIPQYISNLKHGAWQQSGLKAGSMPTNFGLGQVLRGKTLGIWGYGKIGQLLAGYGKAFGMRVLMWGSESSRERAAKDGLNVAESREAFFEESDILSLNLRLVDATRGIVTLADLNRMKPTSLLVNTSRAELIEADALILLSDVDALYDMPPTKAGAKRIATVKFGEDLSSVEIGGSSTNVGTGGAVTKVSAAKVATESGVAVLLTNTDQVSLALDGAEVGTWFEAGAN